MKFRKHRAALFLTTALICPSLALAEPIYSVTFLPSDFTAVEINDAGQIVGNTRSEAWIWNDGGIVNLSRIASGIEAFAINNRGEVAGSFSRRLPDAPAFIYSGGEIRDIGRVAGLNYATPRAINDKGQVAGTAGNFPGETSRGFFYDGTTMTAIDTFGGEQGDAYGLNNKGTVVGTTSLAPPSDRPRGDPRGFVYRDGVVRELAAPGVVTLSADDINDAGMIVGGAEFADAGFQPYLYTGGAFASLGAPGGTARGINNHGAVVGILGGRFDSELSHAFFYDDGSLRDLNDLIVPEPGWTVTEATDINDAGQILGTACFGSTLDCRSVRLDLVPAIPEPNTVAMLLGGLATLTAARRRRS